MMYCLTQEEYDELRGLSDKEATDYESMYKKLMTEIEQLARVSETRKSFSPMGLGHEVINFSFMEDQVSTYMSKLLMLDRHERKGR